VEFKWQTAFERRFSPISKATKTACVIEMDPYTYV